MVDWDRLEVANLPLNAFTDFDRSASGGPGPLAGKTIGIKANIAVKGLPWTGGMELHRERIAQSDAATVAKLREAGAVIIGMLNMEEAALGAKTDNPWFGKTYNPHRIGHTPGGSSGGSAAAVAAGLCDAALGTDTMGSVRVPAAYCGVYGFKPATSAVSQDGLEMTEPGLDVIGPLARSIELLETIGRATSDFGNGALSGKYVTFKALGNVECDEAVLNSFEQAKTLLGAVENFKLADAPSRIRFAGFIKTVKYLSQQYGEANENGISPLLQKLMTYGPKRRDDDWREDQAVLERTAIALRELVAGGATIILPTTPQAAFSQDADAPVNQADFTCLASVADLPAISIPAGRDADSLPVGVQLIAAKGTETGLFALAKELDSKLQSYRPPEYFMEPS